MILIDKDEAFTKKSLPPKDRRSLKFVPQKITIARISIMCANYFNKIHDKSPTELGVRKC